MFGGFTAFWSTLPYLLTRPPFSYGDVLRRRSGGLAR
jgi:hypothetical protein